MSCWWAPAAAAWWCARRRNSRANEFGRLVFADALALFDGECIPDIVKRPTAVTTDLTTGPSREDAASRMFAGLDDATKAWALERYTPHPVAAMRDRVKLPNFWQQSWKANVIWCRQAVNPGEAHQRRAAEKLGATWHELDTGHYPMLSAAEELAGLIVEGVTPRQPCSLRRSEAISDGVGHLDRDCRVATLPQLTVVMCSSARSRTAGTAT